MAVLIQHRNQSTSPINFPNYIDYSRSSLTNFHYSSNPTLTSQQLPKSTSSVPNTFSTPQSFTNNSIHQKHISNTTTVQSSTVSLAAFASDLEQDITNKVLNVLNLNKNNPNNIILVTVCKLVDDITENINVNMSKLGKEFTNSIDILYKQHQQFIEQNRKCMDGFINKLNDFDQIQSNGLKLNKNLINTQNKNNNKFDCMQKQINKMHNHFINSQKILNQSNNKQLDSLQKQIKVLNKKVKNHYNTNQIDEIANKLNKQCNEQQQSSIKINKQMNLILNSVNNTENVYLKHKKDLNKIRQMGEKTDKTLMKFIDSFESSSLSTSVSLQSLKNTLNKYNNNNINNCNSCIEKNNNELLAIGKTKLKNDNDNECVLCTNDLNATLEVFSNKIKDVSMQLYDLNILKANDNNIDTKQLVKNQKEIIKRIGKLNSKKFSSNKNINIDNQMNDLKKTLNKLLSHTGKTFDTFQSSFKQNHDSNSIINIENLQTQNTLIINYLNKISCSLLKNQQIVLAKLNHSDQCIIKNIHDSINMVKEEIIMNYQFELLNKKNSIKESNEVCLGKINNKLKSINDHIDDSILINYDLDEFDKLKEYNNYLYDKSITIQIRNDVYHKNICEIKDLLKQNNCTSNVLINKINKCLDTNLNILTIISNDYDEIKLGKDVNSSELINILYEGDKTNNHIFIPNVSGQLLKKIIEFMNFKYKNPNCDCDKKLVYEWEKNFVEKNFLNNKDLSLLMLKNAANYLGIKPLIKLLSGCELV